MLVRAAFPMIKSSDLSQVPAALMNVLLDIPDWSGIRERLHHQNQSRHPSGAHRD